MNTNKNSKKRKKTEFQSLFQIIKNYDLDRTNKYISREFQDFGYQLAMEMDDLKRVSMYMRFAKTIDRSILEAALSFVKDAQNVKNKSALFMWKLKQIKKKQK